jgi:hypothetical protein
MKAMAENRVQGALFSVYQPVKHNAIGRFPIDKYDAAAYNPHCTSE